MFLCIQKPITLSQFEGNIYHHCVFKSQKLLRLNAIDCDKVQRSLRLNAKDCDKVQRSLRLNAKDCVYAKYNAIVFNVTSLFYRNY